MVKKYILFSVLVVMLTGLQISQIKADDSLNVFYLGKYIGGNSYPDIAVSGDYAYIANGVAFQGLRIVDISNSDNPTAAGQYNTLVDAQSVEINENYAYMGEGGNGFEIIDISNAALPNQIGAYDTPGTVCELIVSGNYAYVADYDSGLRIINISNLSDPQEVGSYDTLGIATSLAIVNNYAYIADAGSGLRIVSISNPLIPEEVGYCQIEEDLRSIAVNGNYAYLADFNYGLRIIDISNANSPTAIALYDTPGNSLKVVVIGNYAYVADGNSGLRVIDISNSTSPNEKGHYTVDSMSAQSVDVQNNKIYLGGTSVSGNGMWILTFDSSGHTPTPTSTSTPDGTSTPVPVYVNAVMPENKISDNNVKAFVIGKNFLSKPDVIMKSASRPDIVAQNVVVKSPFLLTCFFNLTNAAQGFYDLFIDRGDAQAMLPKAFTVLKSNQGELVWQHTSPGDCGVPSVAEGKKGITVSDPDNNGQNDVYVTNRNNRFYKWTWKNSLWSKTELLTIPGLMVHNDILAADLDRDNISELYAAAQDDHVYCYQGQNWDRIDIGAAGGKITALAKGDGDNDGEIEMYASSEDKHVYQFKWNGSSWNMMDMGAVAGALSSVTVGDGNNDDQFEVYVAGQDNKIYEFKYNTTWSVTSIGEGDGPMTDVITAKLDVVSGNQSVYAANQNGKLYQFYKTGSDWVMTLLDSNSGNSVYEIISGDGDNNSTDELYAACSNGHIYQLYLENNQWHKKDIISLGTALYGLAIGDGNNDLQQELYAMGDNSTLYQLKAISIGTPTPTTIPTATPLAGFDGRIISKNHIYAAPNPIRGTLAKLHYVLKEPAQVEMKIFTTSNQWVITYNMDHANAGHFIKEWPCANMANGVYLMRILATSKVDGKKETVIKKIALIK